MLQFRTLKARKAKFGFTAILGVRVDTFQLLAEAQRFIMKADPSAKIELNFNMNSNEFKIYTDNEQAAESFKSKYCI